jgi:hypothetical protein
VKEEAPDDPGPRGATAATSGIVVRVRSALRSLWERVLGADAAWSAFFVATLFAVLEVQHCGVPYGRFQVGQEVPSDVVALHEIDIRDDELTERRRLSASGNVPDVYVLDTKRGERITEEISSLFAEGRKLLGTKDPRAAQEDAVALERRIGAPAFEALRRHGFSPEIEREIVAAVQRVQRTPIIGNRSLLDRAPAVLLVRAPGGGEETVSEFSFVLDLDEARRQVRALLKGSPRWDSVEGDALQDLAASFVDASLSYDPQETAARREAAAAAVPPVMLRIPRGTVLARAGDRFTRDSLVLVEAARETARRRSGALEMLGLASVLAMLAFFLQRYTHDQRKVLRRVPHLHALLVLALLLMIAVAQATISLARLVVDDLPPPFHDASSYAYLVPLGGGAILVGLLANARVAVVFSGFASVVFGALAGWDALRIVWALLVQLAGVYALSAYRGSRTALLRAGLVVGGAGAAAALAVEVLPGSGQPATLVLFGAALALAGGAIGAPLLVSFALPLFEGLFNILTDVRLLELSNGNHPLLARLAVQAPGSYNHSLVVGSLAEEAAKAIGAHALFCRVAAFYHDIGKMQKPDYYVENQHGGNPHDRLAPSMSALVIAAHVKDGVRMAREAGLPEAIVDIIPQHHGTRLMTYFYEKARRTADPELGEVREEEFRYPGPKPRSVEAAIFMLADGVEAAARTVDDPTPSRLREVIRKVVNAVVLDRQLDECDLTFADLEKIQEAFLRSLVGMHHQRLDYPGFVFGRSRSEGRSGGEPAERRASRNS